jgi:carboxypeptidase Taq
MKISNKQIKKLVEEYRKISLLGSISSVMQWDMNVNLPIKAAEVRALQNAYITELAAERWANPEFMRLARSLQDHNGSLEEKAIVRNTIRGGKFYWNIPKKVVVEFSELTSKAFMVWQSAKKEDRLEDFLPYLKKIVEISRAMADYLGYEDNPYDALLDLYEPGLTAKQCESIFSTLQPSLTDLLRRIVSSKDYRPDTILVGGENRYPIDEQRQLALFVLKMMNYDFDAGRLDVSSHPFTDTLGRFDVRITTRYKESDFRESLMGAMHEGGHALYEQGVNPEYELTPLSGGVSLGIHESQSRFWENQIGRSLEFSEFITPILRAFYPTQLGQATPEEVFKLMNFVRPSFIRTEADEVTYNLHIALRFEIENSLINGKLSVDEVGEVWKEKMKEYLGVVPDNNREGVLQDVHWSNGMFGYFPTYTLGNLYAAQFMTSMRKKVDIEDSVQKGQFMPVLSWLRENIHQYGSLYMPEDLCEKVSGEKLNPKYFIDYLESKYSQVYNI